MNSLLNLPLFIKALDQLTLPHEMPFKINLLTWALSYAKHTEQPRLEAILHGIRGTCHMQNLQGNQEENLEYALADFNAVLQIFTCATDVVAPREWAEIRCNRGTAYYNRTRGDRANNLEQALADFDAALEVFTQGAWPLDWAMTLDNRGMVYTERVLGNPKENLQQAIADFDAALTIFSYETASDRHLDVRLQRLHAQEQLDKRLSL